PVQQWVTARPAVPKGSIDKHDFASSILKDRRQIAVYTPPGYDRQRNPYGLVLMFDGEDYLDQVHTPVILDNLVSEQKIPPLVTVFVGNSSSYGRDQLTPNPTFVEFLSKELLPWVHSKYNVSSNPDEIIVGGASRGGLA